MDDWKYSFQISSDRCKLVAANKLCVGKQILHIGDGLVARIAGKDHVFLVEEVEVNLAKSEFTATLLEHGWWADRVNPMEVSYIELMRAEIRLATQLEILMSKQCEMRI